MPSTASDTRKTKNKSGAKSKSPGAKIRPKAAKLASKSALDREQPPKRSEKKRAKKKGDPDRNASSVLSGKVADIVSPLVLHYWNGRGLMEVPRLMLAFAGKFPSDGAYVDARHSRPPAGDSLDANLGRFPFIQTPQGVTIGQSIAINFYVASICGLLGKNATETALVLSFAMHVQELQETWARLVPFGNIPTDQHFRIFFESCEANDFSGPADSHTISKRFALWYCGRIEGLVGSHGFCVGSQFTLADIIMFNAFGDFLNAQENPSLPPHIREPFGSLLRTQALLRKHPKLESIVHSVRSHPGIQTWLNTRGPQDF